MNPPTSTYGKSGITRRLAKVLVVQLLLISVVTVLGVIIAAKVVEGVMMRTALEGEATHFWENFLRDRSHPLPNTDNLRGYLQTEGELLSVPEELAAVHPGYDRVQLGEREILVLVDQHPVDGRNTTLYLVFDEQSVAALSFYFGVVPLSLALIVIYLAAWFGFRQSRKAISPLVSLADRLRRFHLKESPVVSLELDNLKTPDTDDEINVLVDSLNSFTSEINTFVDRERRFSRDASHELRTPLAVIQGSAEIIESEQPLTPNQRKSVERILRTTRDMNELVSSLLILSRGKHWLTELCDVSVNDVIANQIEQLQITHNKDGHVVVHIEATQQVSVHATPQFVEAVCGNLLRNAFNYTRKGEVSVLLDKNLLQVSNKGEGVEVADPDTIFKPFVRGAGDASVEGYGVGLDIVKRLCDLFGWQINAEFSPETGAVFRLRFSPVSSKPEEYAASTTVTSTNS